MNAIPISAAMLAAEPYGFQSLQHLARLDARHGDGLNQINSAEMIAAKWRISRAG